MKKENQINNSNIPNADEFWPEAEALLDKHYAAKKRKIILWSITSMITAVILVNGIFSIKLKNNNTAISNFKIESKETPSIKSNTINGQCIVLNKKVIDPLSDVQLSNNVVVSNANTLSHHITKSISQNVSNSIPMKGQHTESRGVETVVTNDLLVKKNTDELLANSENVEPPSADLSLTDLSKNISNSSNKSAAEIVEMSSSQNQPNISQEVLKREDVNFELLKPYGIFLQPNSWQELAINNGLLQNVKANPDDYVINKNKLYYSISVYGGLQQVSKILKHTPELVEYTDVRNASEKKATTCFYGVSFNMQKNKLLFSTGIEYNTFAENNQYKGISKQWQVSDESKWNTYNTQVLKIDTHYIFGIVKYETRLLNVKDSSLQIQHDSVFVYAANPNILKANKKTKLSYIEIPLMLGYEFKRGKFAINPMAGISVGYLIERKGMYINKSLTDVEEMASIKDIKSYMINYCFKLQMIYKLNHTIGIFIAPQLKANAISLTQKSFGVSTHYNSFGALAGLNFEF